jgi:hypothetical protein
MGGDAPVTPRAQTGLYAEPYSAAAESNGVHLSSYDHDTCTFAWTVPESGAGEVRPYLAGHRNHTNGPNATLVLVSGQASGPVVRVPRGRQTVSRSSRRCQPARSCSV